MIVVKWTGVPSLVQDSRKTVESEHDISYELRSLFRALSGITYPELGVYPVEGPYSAVSRIFASAAAAIWLATHVGLLTSPTSGFREVRGDVATADHDGHLAWPRFFAPIDPDELVFRLSASLGLERDSSAQDWGERLRALCIEQATAPTDKFGAIELLRWASDVELAREGNNRTTAERLHSLRAAVALDMVESMTLNNLAYALLGVELATSGVPIATAALERARSAESLDTLGWGLFQEEQYDMAAVLLREAEMLVSEGSEEWVENQYHQLRTALRARDAVRARRILDHVRDINRGDDWTRRSVELEADIEALLQTR